ncbi:MAG: biotin carboxylase N-terminal domain-containing protein [Acidimicrobiia bacterium]
MRITKLLVANRGEIACRVMRTARDLGIRTVAVFSDPDERARFVAMADEAVRLPGNAATDTYLRGDLIVDAARRTGAEAVHPGYGFLSEDAAFSRACEDAGIVFVGPPASVVEAMGSKLEAKRLMAAAGVPVLPGATVDAADEVGYPLLVKAAFGGGGRGMRVVTSPHELADAVDSAQREAASAFGDGTVFLERFVERPRHVEVQVFADQQGSVVHLFERECSIQRRHQKIVEEAPCVALDDAQRGELCEAAVSAAKAIGYVNAGTVEFLLDEEDRFWFLEVNTRLQVEHPVTELVTGLDLVALQLAVAQGEPLPPEVYAVPMSGHAIEARVYAEDVAAGYLPVSGTLHRFRIPEHVGVRVDAGYAAGSVVSPFYDALLAKVIAWAPTREAAVQRLSSALASAELHGPVTNRDLLVRVLEDDDFLAGRIDTGFLERLAPVDDGPRARVVAHHAIAAALAARAERRAYSPLARGIPAGWRNVGPAMQPEVFEEGDVRVEVRLELASVRVDGVEREVRVFDARPDAVDVEIDDGRRRYSVQRVGDTVYVDSSLGASALHVVDRFPVVEEDAAPGSLLAPLPGSAVQVAVVVGQRVTAGDVLVVLEAMKMEHTVRAPFDGTVTEVRVELGEQVDSGDVLVVVEPGEGGDA